MRDKLKAFGDEVYELANQSGSFTGGAAHVFRELRVILRRYDIEPPFGCISEPGVWAVVEASCVHSDVRRHWVRSDNDNWYPVDSDETTPDGWDSLVDPVLVREGIGEPNPCGHADVLRGCGGCDPSAIEFELDGFAKVEQRRHPEEQATQNLSSGVNAGQPESLPLSGGGDSSGTGEVPNEAKGTPTPCAAAQSHEWVRKQNFIWDGRAEPPYEVCEHCLEARRAER